MMRPAQDDPYLDKWLAKYDKWLDKGLISFSSRVIPVSESIDAQKWVLPTEQAFEIIRDARKVALQPCECRSHYGHCNKPRDVCFMLNESAEKRIAKGQARAVEAGETRDILKEANRSGLIHLSLYMPDHEVFALCSCCSCCCHDLQLVQRFERKDLMMRSEFVAVSDADACTHCGDCIDRCMFGVRSYADDGTVAYAPEACVGCGLCVTTCPAEAVSMQRRS